MRPQTLNIPKVQVTSSDENNLSQSGTNVTTGADNSQTHLVQHDVTSQSGEDNPSQATSENVGVVPSQTELPVNEEYERRNIPQGRLAPITEVLTPRKSMDNREAIDEENTHL